MEKTTGLLSLNERREEKLLRQCEKMKRLPSNPLHPQLEALTINRLKIQSPNHHTKALKRKLQPPLPASDQPLEFLRDHDDWQHDTPATIFDIQGIKHKECHTEDQLKTLTLETLNTNTLLPPG